ncbi:hypothetical protein WJX77_009214 [Trebouxia sp. C0004]
MKRVPSFSSRPGFPVGLQVLLVEADKHSREKVSKQLKNLSYDGTCCSTTVEAASILSNGSNQFDIVLAEAKAVAKESPAFVHSLNGLPLVLMSEGGSASEVWKSIELGAAEYLEKPLSTLKLRNIWQHVVRKMMHGCEEEDSSYKLPGRDSAHASSSLLQQKSSSQPGSPSTPSALSSGVDHDFTLVNDSLKSFKCEGVSSSSHSDPSELFLPDITSDTSDSKSLLLQTSASTAHVSTDSTPVPAAKKLRRSSTKDSSTTTAHTASITHRPRLAIRPAPSGFPMMIQPVMGMGGGQLGGYQNTPGYVWGTPMAGAPMDSSSSWQVATHASAGGLERHHSLPVGNPVSPFYSQASCNAGHMELDHSLSLDLGPSNTVLSLNLGAIETVLDNVPALNKIFFDGLPGSPPPKSPPIGLQLRKSESFLDLINEHLKQANSA